MKLLFKPTVLIAGVVCVIAALALQQPGKKEQPQADSLSPAPKGKSSKKIQAAILLDVSNSMDGLIDQAKAQLWNMVSVMGKAKCSDGVPEFEIALYEYGRDDNDIAKGYVKQISPFTTDLDKLSQNLFGLTTNGGDEYCGQVIYTSLQELNWDSNPDNYKVIFIAGNEDFLQGNLLYTRACDEAKKRSVIVNTIYCGDKMQGIREHWNLNRECGSGSFTNINQDAKIEDIPTPYDSTIFTLNDKLNGTYMAYGYAGMEAYETQAKVDKMNYSMNKSVAAKRVEVKSKKGLYKNGSWDMVDAALNDKKFADNVDMKTLPDSLKDKSRDELKLIIEKKSTERSAIQKEIESTSAKRETWLAAEKSKRASADKTATLESEIENIIKQQAKKFHMVIQ